MNMKINNIKDIDKFFKAVDSCKGKVLFISKDGDCINLKSQLAKYVVFSSVFNDKNIRELDLQCENPEDITIMMNYMVNR